MKPKQVYQSEYVVKKNILPEKMVKNKPLFYLIMSLAMGQIAIMLALSYHYLGQR